MTNKYNVQLITDVNGKPMPQYYDETEGVMKPITRDNGEITGDVNANVSFPETQNINGTVSVDNFPKTQQVEVTNQKEVQDVNVTNQATSVDVNNFPELQDVSDAQVRSELEQIKATQSQILYKLNNSITTKNEGDKVEEIELLPRKLRTSSENAFMLDIPKNVKRWIILLRIYSVSGDFAEGEGYSTVLIRQNKGNQLYVVARTKPSIDQGNYSGNIYTIGTDVIEFNDSDRYLNVSDTLIPDARLRLVIEGSFGEGQGIDCDAVAYYIY